LARRVAKAAINGMAASRRMARARRWHHARGISAPGWRVASAPLALALAAAGAASRLAMALEMAEKA